MKNKLILYTIIVTSSFLFVNCEEPEKELDPEVYIINTFRSHLLGGSIIVKYQIENNINDNINGWKVYFEVSLTNNRQLIAIDQAEYPLDSGEFSNTLEAKVKLPEYFTSDVKPRRTVIKKIDIY